MPLVFLVLSPSKTLSNLELMLQGESASSDYIIPTQIIRSQTSFSNHFINLWLRRILDFSFLSPLWSKLIHLSFTIMSFTGFSTIIIISTSQTLGSSGGSDGKESACNAGDLSSIPGLGRLIPWRRERQPTSVFLPGKSQGQRSLEGYSPWGHKKSDTTKQLFTSLHSQT